MKMNFTVLVAIAISSFMNHASASITEKPVNLDKLIKADTVTKTFVTSVTVQSQVTNINEGVEIYKRENGTCYQLSRKVVAVHPDETNILDITLELPEISSSEKEVSCPDSI
jgi:hypothetical protein